MLKVHIEGLESRIEDLEIENEAYEADFSALKEKQMRIFANFKSLQDEKQ